MLDLATRYTNTNPASASYPTGSFKNKTSSILKDGTPFEEDWPNDIQGFFQAVLAWANITASGSVETAVASQLLQAIKEMTGQKPVITPVTGGGNFTVTKYHKLLLVDATGGNTTVDMLAANSADAQSIKIMRAHTDVSGNTVTLDPAGAHTIMGAATIPLIAGEGYEFIPDGTSDWLQF